MISLQFNFSGTKCGKDCRSCFWSHLSLTTEGWIIGTFVILHRFKIYFFDSSTLSEYSVEITCREIINSADI